MRHLGILAHSAEGAALCFRAFCQEGFARLGPHEHPDVTLDCITLARSMPAWDRGDHGAVRATLAESVRRLARAGADFFVCPDNTAHMALELPGPELALGGLHIAEVVADQAARDGHRQVGVLGTGFTMDGPVYPRVLAARGITAQVPDPRRPPHRGPDHLRRAGQRGVHGRLAPGLPGGHRAAGRPGLHGGRPGLHRDPAAGDARGLPVAHPRLDPAAGSCRLRGGRRRPAPPTWRGGPVDA